jgi:hypothetical protein
MTALIPIGHQDDTPPACAVAPIIDQPLGSLGSPTVENVASGAGNGH